MIMMMMNSVPRMVLRWCWVELEGWRYDGVGQCSRNSIVMIMVMDIAPGVVL